MFHRRTFITLAAFSAVAACTRNKTATIPDGTTLIMVRHSDRDGLQLSDKGRARSEALVGALDGIDIDAIYAPRIQRNLYTAAPLAAARGLEVQRTNPLTPADAFLEIVADSAGQTIVWVGNMDNLSPIWAALALEGPPPLQYGDLFIVESGSSGSPQITRRRFGPE